MNDSIAILYTLARSGGTLVSKCLGCIPGNVLLSEVNPRLAYFNPLAQARDWFGLISNKDIRDLQNNGQYNYLDSIRLISSRCRTRRQKLIIRDWTHVDFTPGNYPVKPTYILSQYESLKQYFHVNHIAITRHPLDSFLSLSKLPDYKGRLDLQEYLKGARAYADVAKMTGFVRFEDFCMSPQDTLKKICNTLELNYDKSFLDSYIAYTTVTGDNYHPSQRHTLTGDLVKERAPETIRLPPRRAEFSQISKSIQHNEDYRYILDTLGY
jgi:hypothetical protein